MARTRSSPKPKAPRRKTAKSKIVPSRFDAQLLYALLSGPFARNWEGHHNCVTYDPCNLVSVSFDSNEFCYVADMFYSSISWRRIYQLYRVENPYLLGSYLIKRTQMALEGGRVQERHLFHGTRSSYVDSICEDNFNWRYYGLSRGHKFGQGMSFAVDASYAQHYTNGDGVMILARVLTARTTRGYSTTVVPPESCDSTRNNQGTVIVKYEDDDFYPEYVIYF